MNYFITTIEYAGEACPAILADGHMPPTEEKAALLALLRRDWATRVLDKAEPIGWVFEWHGKKLTALTPGATYRFFDGSEKAETRHAAALAVFPKLPADVRAELGECP